MWLSGSSFASGYGFAGHGNYIGDGLSMDDFDVVAVDFGGIISSTRIDVIGIDPTLDPETAFPHVRNYTYMSTPDDMIVLYKLKYGETRTQKRSEEVVERWLVNQTQWPVHYVVDWKFGPVDKLTADLFKQFVLAHDGEMLTITDTFQIVHEGLLIGSSIQITRLDWQKDQHLSDPSTLALMGSKYLAAIDSCVGQGHFEISVQIELTGIHDNSPAAVAGGHYDLF